jgi:hypothetical protein
MFAIEQLSRQLLGGIFLLLSGLGILLASALNTPPTLQQMAQVEVPLSGTVRVLRGGRRGAYIAVPLGTMRGEVRYLCSQADCTIPARFAVLQPGVIVRVWLDDLAVWQLQVQDQVVVDYAEVRADYQHQWHMAMLVALLLVGAGAVLVYWGLRPAPVQAAFFDR